MPTYQLEIYGYSDTAVGHFNVGLVKVDNGVVTRSVFGLNIPDTVHGLRNLGPYGDSYRF